MMGFKGLKKVAFIACGLGTSAMLLSACATVTRGTKDKLKIISEPAGAQVRTSNGFSCASTPCELKIPRKSSFNVQISKAGCQPAVVHVTNKFSAKGGLGMAGNIIFGGAIGIGVDSASGATQDLYPNPVQAKLQCGNANTAPAKTAPQKKAPVS